MISEASVMGVSDAQEYLREAYSKGIGVEMDAERATRYYRLCAAAGNPGCQYKLAKIQPAAPNRSERTYIQALAWRTSS
jgi:TPR repeat protein